MQYFGPHLKTYLDTEEVRKSHGDVFEKQFTNDVLEVGGKLIKRENFFLVFPAFRLFAEKNEQDLPPNVIVLDRKCLQKLYGNSLSYRPQFIAEYCSEYPTAIVAPMGAKEDERL